MSVNPVERAGEEKNRAKKRGRNREVKKRRPAEQAGFFMMRL